MRLLQTAVGLCYKLSSCDTLNHVYDDINIPDRRAGSGDPAEGAQN